MIVPFWVWKAETEEGQKKAKIMGGGGRKLREKREITLEGKRAREFLEWEEARSAEKVKEKRMDVRKDNRKKELWRDGRRGA